MSMQQHATPHYALVNGTMPAVSSGVRPEPYAAICPHCLDDGKLVLMLRLREEYSCPECGQEYSAGELIAQLSQAVAELITYRDQCAEMDAELCGLRAKVDAIKNLVGVAA